MKIKNYLAIIFFSCITISLHAQGAFGGVSHVLGAPAGYLQHKYGFRSGIEFSYESTPKLRISKNLPITLIYSFDMFKIGDFDRMENVAYPYDHSRRSVLNASNTNTGFNFGTRLSMNAIKRVSLYGEVFSSLRYFNSRAFFVPHGDNEEDCPKESYKQVFNNRIVPQVGFGGGIKYRFFEVLYLNFRFTYSTGRSVPLVHHNNVTREENDVVSFNLDEPARGDFLTFRLGIVWGGEYD